MRTSPTDAATSARMSRIRRKGTNVELVVGRMLRDLGLRYRKNVRGLPGSPDFANKSKRWAVFVNGCYWHHHSSCRKATVPKTNTDFWLSKFRDNRLRDARTISKLRGAGYRVVLIWECEVEAMQSKLGKILEPRRIQTR